MVEPIGTVACLDSIVDAARGLWKVQSDRLRDLLNQSHESLQPFGDPFGTDFGAHRWLSSSREEVYSDWLAWIVEQIKDPRQIFAMFGIDESLAEDCHGGVVAVDREVWVPKGHPGRSGRLDLVIKFAGVPRAVIEVKRGSADEPRADTGKHIGYMDWLKEWPNLGNIQAQDRAILLALDGKKKKYDGFQLQRWSDVCVALRRIVPRLRADRGLLTAAMILAFVSAVEQNLMRFSAQLVSLVLNGRSPYLSPNLCAHIEKSLGGSRMHEEQEHPEELLTLLVRGTDAYMCAQAAIHQYKGEVVRICSKVVSKRLDALREATGIDIPEQITENVRESHSGNENPWSYLAVKLDLKDFGESICGLCWGFDNAGSGPVVVVLFNPNKDPGRAVLHMFQREGGVDRVRQGYQREIAILDTIKPDEMKDFCAKLDDLIGEWIVLWKKVGGINGLRAGLS